ncbi:unnamed protein product [Pedinophyceae sp. YPF-701]|nr:unnamed protein product [Pedinophyceae sp. YPF-701]
MQLPALPAPLAWGLAASAALCAAALAVLACLCAWSAIDRVANRAGGGPVMVVLGSGGHSAEMTALLRAVLVPSGREDDDLDTEEARAWFRESQRLYVIAETDTGSATKAKALEADVRKQAVARGAGKSGRAGGFEILRIPRSREVHQSYVSSVATTLRSTLHALHLVLRHRPAAVVANGPGTCLPVCLCAAALSWLRVQPCKVIFFESICRVSTLSLTAKIVRLLRAADPLLVQWEEAAQLHPGCVFRGRVY